MNEFERLLAYLKVSYHNLTTLHRHLIKDAGWFGNHEELGSWYEAVADQLDDLTEIGLSLGYAEPSIKDAVLLFNADILGTEPRELKETLKFAGEIIRSIAGAMKSAETIAPPDVQNKLQEYEYGWNKIANYKIAHALGDKFRAGGKVEEDDD